VRVRATAQVVLSGGGAGQVEVYTCPSGWEFSLRRVTLDLDTVTDPNTGAVLLNGAGKYVEYLRAGTHIEFGQPQYGAGIQVPGVQTWGDQQGPYFRNAETFEVRAAGLTASTSLRVIAEGLLYRPAKRGPKT
jgi:hypothetical protein